ncbi:SCO2400 family protein [Streptomyces sp. NRRL F-5123]|uniref:SCO2400 family protein n=1 Tax=Streptomyces sp. NRRL F-5123 TaxID=1463856 RepID=UPI003B63880F
MDYCYQCRRNLNGALVCPGCGAYAPDIAPPASAYQAPDYPDGPIPESDAGPVGHTTPGRSALSAIRTEAPVAEPPLPVPARRHPIPEPLPYDADFGGTGVGAADFGGTDGGADGSGDEPEREPLAALPAAGGGRAARRHAQARWRRNRRRAVAASAVALAGGGLTIAAMPTGGSGGATNAATAPDAPVGDALPTVTSPATTPPPAVTAPSRAGTPAPPHPAATSTPGHTRSVPLVPRTRAPQQAADRSQRPQPAPSSSAAQPTTAAPQPTATTPPPAATATPPTATATPPAATGPTAPPHEICVLILCL